MNNKRGQEGMGIGTLLALLIGLAVAVIVILGFTLGWDKILPWLSPENVDTLVTQCNVACTASSQYGFCTQNRTVNDGTNEKFDATCYQLATEFASRGYGIESCSGIECP